MRLLSIPRDANPYQENLYGELRRRGLRVAYLGAPTPSATLNWLLLPAELALRWLRGWRLVHVHWLYPFAAPLSGRVPALARVSGAWFGLWLWLAGRLRMRIVWTAHNALPHEQLFGDDLGARRRLLDAADLVIVHSPEALEELSETIGPPRRAAVVPHGRFVDPAAAAGLPAPGAHERARELLFFGRMLPYKGLDELAEAAAQLPADTPLRIRITGPCGDPALCARLTARAAELDGRLIVEPGFVAEADLAALFAGADGVVLPFRRITTSGSAEMALNYGRPLLVPDLPALRALPDDATLRYAPDDGLPAALQRFATAELGELAQMSAAAVEHSRGGDWAQIAETTHRLLGEIVHGRGPRQPEKTGPLAGIR